MIGKTRIRLIWTTFNNKIADRIILSIINERENGSTVSNEFRSLENLFVRCELDTLSK